MRKYFSLTLILQVILFLVSNAQTSVTVSGAADEEEIIQPEEKKRLLNIFNSLQNKEGKFVKLILGSRVMNEGITLENVRAVHILDVYYNFARVQQVVGRAIRLCKHYRVMTEEDPYPEVKIYKYVVSLSDTDKSGTLSSEEDLYRKAELKYLLVKKVERSIKEAAIDCPINYHANVFPEEVAPATTTLTFCCTKSRTMSVHVVGPNEASGIARTMQTWC